MQWELVPDPVNPSQIEKYRKRHPKEFDLCAKNLARLMNMLKMGVTLQQATHSGFFSPEGHNVYRIGQERKRCKETRLYVHALIMGGDIHVLRIGDKDSQKADVAWCHDYVKSKIRESQEGKVGNE